MTTEGSAAWEEQAAKAEDQVQLYSSAAIQELQGPAQFLGEALELAERGWRLHPLRDKEAILKGWPERATADPDQLERWAREFPGCTWGIATGRASGVVALDVDDLAAFAAWRAEHKIEVPATHTATTPRGGYHYFFAAPAEPLGNWAKRIPGCDFKAERGYVVAPIGAPGRSWAPTLGPDDVELAPLPEWLSPPAQPEAKTKAAPLPERIADGGRNIALTSLAGSMRCRGAGEAAILAALKETNREQCKPPLPDDEVAKIARSIAGYEPAAEDHKLTDLGNSELFVEQHGADLRYCAQHGAWYGWDGCRFLRDETRRTVALAAETARSQWARVAAATDLETRKALAKHVASSESRGRIDAAVSLASAHQSVAVRAADFDRGPWLLNVANGTVDLRSGKLRPHRRDDLLTKMAGAAFDPSFRSALWERTLARLLPDAAVRDFFQRAFGYCLTGITIEQILIFIHGPGNNGKSTVLNAILRALGDYACQAPEGLLTAAQHQQHPTELTTLEGRRLAITTEIGEGRAWNEARVKALTGGELVVCRHMKEDFYSFAPTHKLVVAANHLPTTSGSDRAMWRRIRLIPFTAEIADSERDHELPDKLAEEVAGILTWAVEGCLKWQRHGLGAPDAVVAATAAYKSDQDVVGHFLRDTYIRSTSPSARVPNSELRAAYEKWCHGNGERPLSSVALGLRLEELGVPKYQTNTSRGRVGLVPVTSSDEFGAVPHSARRESVLCALNGEEVESRHDSSPPDPEEVS